MKIAIKGLIGKSTAGGQRYYWQPNKPERDAGWTAQPLGRDLDAAIAAAKARNAEIDAWRTGGARPREVKKHIQRATFGALIAEYEASDRFTRRADSTRREYKSCLRSLDAWAGAEPLAAITRARVQKLKEVLQSPATPGGPLRLARAKNVISVLYNVMKLAKDSDRIVHNPAAEAGLEGAPARVRWAADHEIDALVAAAERLGRPSVAVAILMATGFGQRQGDLLKATWSQWKDGRLRLRQGKTKVWVNVRAMDELRIRLDALRADNARRDVPRATILINENTGQPWASHAFQVAYRMTKAEAARPTIAGADGTLAEPCAELEDLEFRDFRRTAVVRLAEAEVDLPGITAITGHKIERAKKILEVYMPRTDKMADAAIDRLEAHRTRERARDQQEGQG